jgi:aspartokinase
MISHTGAINGHLSVSFTINSKDRKKTESVLNELSADFPPIRFGIADEISKLTVEGPGMEFQSGIAHRVFSCMAETGISIMAVTTSESKISYVIASGEVPKAILIIKKEFGI